jgi:subtilisin family serine protease
VDNWKVDIISLSLGFTKDDDGIREEVRLASAKSTLVFAAANNTRNEDKPVQFPARMKEVICVFSSDAYGIPSEFNPVPNYNRANFMFPGQRIEGAWPSEKADDDTFSRNGTTYKYGDGTSCSTPIAAAVAAGVLEFAWQKRAHEIRNIKLLKHISGMSAVFLEIMVDDHKARDNSYHYVKPWKLISQFQLK